MYERWIQRVNTVDFEHEKQRLAYTLKCLNAEMNEISERLEKGIEAADPVAVEAITKRFLHRLRTMNLVAKNPYFSRIDFKPNDGKAGEYYIGKTTLMNEATDVLVIDWRAPIATLYYDGRTGDAEYTCPDGLIEGEMLLKRQFQIKDCSLQSFDDIDITFDDELLAPYLGVSADTRLKNIIATIQSEQNRIIRTDMIRPLIVQGVAGSGKTTVALHRIAYLIYTYAATFKPDEFLIIAPNTIFLDYISNVLPDLGVENVRQQTFEAFAQTVIGKKLKIENTGEKLATILDGQEHTAAASAYKSSLDYRGAIDNYLADLEKCILPCENFRIGGFLFCPYETIQSMFVTEYHQFSYYRRTEFIKEKLKRTIEEHAKGVIARIDAIRRHKIDLLQNEGLPAEEFKKRKAAIYGEHEEIVKDLLNGGKNAVKAYMKKISLPSASKCYHDFVSHTETLKKYCIGENVSDSILSFITDGACKGRIEYEDLAPLMYLHFRIKGLDKSLSVRHVVIDEAQDFSMFQFAVLKKVLNCNSFTILGDLSQGIYWYRGTNDWNEVIDSIFKGNCSLLTLTKSYRSTVEIIEQANIVLSKLPSSSESDRAQAVIRHGEPVRFIGKKSDEEIAVSAAARIRELQTGGMENIAVICKTSQGCAAFAKELKVEISDFSVMNGKEDKYSGGLSILPSYLVKGLEFDAVLIADAHRYTSDMLDSKLLYVAMTRAMHCMDIYYIGEKPGLFME
jgi:DNA helicase-2/ATP-dependent DNA helicase PcrA